MTRKISVVGAAVAMTFLATRAHADKASLGLSDGSRFSFELVRTAGRAAPSLLSSGVMGGQGAGYRILMDKSGGYIGYSVKASAVGTDRFRLEIGPLPADVRERMAREGGLVGDPLPIEYPEPQEVRADEPVLLELMVNPGTGEKLGDVIRVHSAAPRKPEDHLVIQKAQMKIDGVPRSESGGASGRLVWFHARDHGRFVFTREESAQHALLPVEISEDRKTLTVLSGGRTYEWALGQPVDLGSGTRLFVLVDPTYKGRGSFGVGTLGSLDEVP